MIKDRGEGSPLKTALILPFVLLLSLTSVCLFSLSGDETQAKPAASSPSQSRSAASPPQKQTGESEPTIKVLARNYDQKENRILASGNVEVQYGKVKLFADEVDVNTETKDVVAKGNVVLQSEDQVVSAESIFYNLDTHRGSYEQVYGMAQPTVFYQAKHIEQKAEDLFGLTKATLTTCTQPVPRWNFTCTRANYKRNDYVEMWNSVLTIKKVPVFYLPYLRYPLDKERATGFLMPQAGYSGVKGIFYGQSFYWAIARNMDATFSADIYSEKGFGGGLEYRYLFGDGTGGTARVYYFLFKDKPAAEESSHAYILRFNHNQPLPWGFRVVANIDYQTSFDFLREFDNDFKRASITNLRSEAYISRSWSYYNFSLRYSRFLTYYTNINNSVITYYRPQISLNSFKIKLFNPFFFSFSSAFTSWRYGWKSDYESGREKYYDNIKFEPTLSLPFSKIPWLTVNSSLSSVFSFYAQSFAPSTRQIINDPLFLFNYAFSVEAIGPVFYRIFQSTGGASKVKHLFEPFVKYRYDSPVTEPERVITSYGFFRYHQITYGLTNRVLVKRDMPREVFTWGISQTYYLSPEDSPLSFYRWEGEVPRFSDISSYLRFYPARKYSFDVSTGYNVYYKTLSFLRLGVNLNSPADPLFLSVNWYKYMNPWHKDVLGDRQQVGVFGRLDIPRLSLELLGDFDFNVLERKLLYSGVSLVYHYQCLDFKADVRVFYYRETPETQFRVSVGLGNIGRSTDILGGFGF